ncbi:NAD(P)H-binding protein [Corynebacterium confusum]
MTVNHKPRVLIIGGHGKVAQLAAPKLREADADVTSLIRNPEQQADIEKMGATPYLADVTQLTVEDWAQLETQFDAVVWSAGNGGRGGEQVTIDVDQDAALASIHGLEQLRDQGAKVPRYVMVSYKGATQAQFDPDHDLYTYSLAKKVVDDYLNSTDLDYVILGPAVLTDEPAAGIELVADQPATSTDEHTSRELVAAVIAEVVTREQTPHSPVSFVDGEGALSEIT